MNSIPDKLIRLPKVIERTSLSRTSIYDLISKKLFPAQIKIAGGRSSAWSNNAVTDFIQEQKEKAGQ